MAEDMNKSAAETEEEYQPDLMTLEDEDGNDTGLLSCKEVSRGFNKKL